ncbi:MAG: hypothetical protein ABI574_18280 [Burkholderiales bacterium]
MGFLDALLHLFNFLLPAMGLGAIAAALAKLLWRRELRGARWSRLALWASGASALALGIGLMLWGRDGRMGTYAAMALAAALALWATGFGLRRGAR